MKNLNSEIFADLVSINFHYIVIETKFTTHHIERLHSSSDRGRIKWIGETKFDAWEQMGTDEEAKRSHIDGGDLFPRLYFKSHSFINEFGAWLDVRGLEITKIYHGEIE